MSTLFNYNYSLIFWHSVFVSHMTFISISRCILMGCVFPAGISSTSSLQKEL